MLVVAHYGIDHVPPEAGQDHTRLHQRAGTMAALTTAVVHDLPIAVDVHESGDFVAACWPSDVVRADPRCVIAEMTARSLVSMKVPLLQDVLGEFVGRTTLFLELCSYGSGRAAANALRRLQRRDLHERITVSAQKDYLPELRTLSEAFPRIPIAWVRNADEIDPATYIEQVIRNHRFQTVHLEYQQCTREVVSWFMRRGCRVSARNVPSGEVALNLWRGTHINTVFSGRADAVHRELLQRLQQQHPAA